MAVTLAIIVAVQVAIPLWVRPHLIPPDRTVVGGPSFFALASMSVGTLAASTVPGQPEAWILSSGAINAAGRPVSTIPAACLPSSAAKAPDPGQCMASRGIREAITVSRSGQIRRPSTWRSSQTTRPASGAPTW